MTNGSFREKAKNIIFDLSPLLRRKQFGSPANAAAFVVTLPPHPWPPVIANAATATATASNVAVAIAVAVAVGGGVDGTTRSTQKSPPRRNSRPSSRRRRRTFPHRRSNRRPGLTRRSTPSSRRPAPPPSAAGDFQRRKSILPSAPRCCQLQAGRASGHVFAWLSHATRKRRKLPSVECPLPPKPSSAVQHQTKDLLQVHEFQGRGETLAFFFWPINPVK